MAQLGTADVTYTAIVGTQKATPSDPEREQMFTMLFPNGANILYTNGGVPISLGKLGCSTFLDRFLIVDAASSTGYVPKFDYSAATVRLYQVAAVVTGSATPAQQLVELTTAATVASCTLRVIAKGW